MQLLCATSCSGARYYSTEIKMNLGKGGSQCSFKQPKQYPGPDIVHRLASPLIATAAILALSTPLIAPPPSSASQPVVSRGAKLFQKACIGCHDMGGNILQPGSTLFTRDLQRNGVTTEEDIYNITYYGKGRMPGFGEKCTPRGQCTFGPRLQEDEIKLLAEFVRSQADSGWPNIEIYGD